MLFEKPIVSPKNILEIMRFYSVGDVLECKYLGGVPNVTYRVKTREQDLTVRISNHGYTSFEHLELEIEILQHLKNVGYSESPRLIAGKNGEIIQEWNKYWLIATEYITGETVDRVEITESLCEDVGRAVATLQRALAAFKKPIPQPHTFIARGTRLIELLPETVRRLGWQLDYRSLIKEWERACGCFEASRDSLPYGILHADVWPPNVICEGERIVGVIDFDDWCYGPRVIDFCAPLIEFAMFNTTVMNEDLAIAFLQGYFGNGGAISESEEDLIIEAIEMVCASWLACNALHEITFEESKVYLNRLELLQNSHTREVMASDIRQLLDIVQKIQT